MEGGGYRPSDAINACSKSISDKTNFYSSITFVDNKRFLATGRLVQSIERERERRFSSKFHYPCIFIEFERTDQSKENQRKKKKRKEKLKAKLNIYRFAFSYKSFPYKKFSFENWFSKTRRDVNWNVFGFVRVVEGMQGPLENQTPRHVYVNPRRT